MNLLRLSLLVALMAVGSAPAAHSADMAKVKSEICKARATCHMTSLQSAGASDSGVPLMVAKFHFDLADKPKDAPDTGCQTEEEVTDGGVEYWLIEEGKAPRLLLQLCNDGYGAAGVGYDEVHVGPNRLTHIQDGGSNDRWETTDMISLSPQRTLRTENCGFRASDPNYGVYGWVDVPNMTAQSLAIDDAVQTNADATADNDDPCTALKKRIGKPLEHGYLGGLDVPWPTLNADSTEPGVVPPKGTALGSCATSLIADGKSGYVVYGKPDPSRVAELRFVAPDPHNIVIQVRDARPDKSAPQSWVNYDHLEIWMLSEIGQTIHVDPESARQIGIDLEGNIYAGVGSPERPEVERWRAVDEQNRPVVVFKLHWKNDEALYGGVAIAYSEAEHGIQERIFSTGPIVKNRPLYLPDITSVPVTCGVVNGRWDVTSNPGDLTAGEIAN